MSIEVKNLFKYYGDQAAVKDISFKVNSGEVVGFLGPNGAGKSTTMKVIRNTLKDPKKHPLTCNGGKGNKRNIKRR